MNANPAPPRAQGLDSLRALAISWVFMYHYMVFVSREPTFGWASRVGWVGVDLFFVLSGYLIANQLFSGLAAGRRLSLPKFFARRALRTLPVFWTVLAAYVALPALLGGTTPPPLWRFLTFTQNFGLRPGTAFSHAWSLCIEEQFYLALPLLLALGIRLRLGRRSAWVLLVTLVGVGIAARAGLWTLYGRESGGRIDGYYPAIYYATLCRFDEFLPGVAVALIKNFHRPAWARLTRHGPSVLALGTLATMGMLALVLTRYEIDGFGYGFFMTAFGYSLLALAFALLVVAALSPGSALHRLRVPGAGPLALASYSIYLSHKAVAHVLQQTLAPLGWGGAPTLAAISVASLGVGVLLYRTIEAPFMAWRDRWVPSSFSTGGRAEPALDRGGGATRLTPSA